MPEVPMPQFSAPPRRRPVARARAGLTLIEMLIVISVIGIVMAIAVPRINIRTYRMSAAVRSTVSMLNYEERLAVSLQHDIRVSIDSTNRRFRIHEDKNNDNVIDAGERVTYHVLDDGVSFGQGAAPAVPGLGTFADRQDGYPVIVFRRDGTASENGGFYITSDRGATAAKDARALEIVRSPGKVIWYSYGSGNWTRGN